MMGYIPTFSNILKVFDIKHAI